MAPYFPLALAVSSKSPLQFNFNLPLLDHLRLPCELVARMGTPTIPTRDESSQEVSFNTSQETVSYCQQHLREGWLLEAVERDPGKSQPRLSHPAITKEQLFQQECKSLEKVPTSGIPELDLALDQVWLDR